MASLISQLRNNAQPSQTISNSIEQTKQLMQQLANMPNRQQALNSLIQSNPQLAAIMKSQNGLEAFARSLAQSKGIDIDALIKQLNT